MDATNRFLLFLEPLSGRLLCLGSGSELKAGYLIKHEIGKQRESARMKGTSHRDGIIEGLNISRPPKGMQEGLK